MPNELERAFGVLSDEAGRAQLAPAQAVRRRGDRQTFTRAAAGAAAVAVLVTGVTVGARVVLAGPDHRPMPVPADSPSPPVVPPGPSPTQAAPTRPVPSSPDPSSESPPPASAPPPPSTQESTASALPKSVPARAFLQESDVPGQAKGAPEWLGAGDHKMPEFCGNDYDRASAARATQVLLYASADAPPDSTPKSAVYEDVIVFRGDGAERFMNDLRAAVRDCATDGDVKHLARGPVGAGDESLLIERNRPATTDEGSPVGDGSLHRVYFAAVRIGDSVAFLADTGWESGSAERTDTIQLARRAAARLEAWRR